MMPLGPILLLISAVLCAAGFLRGPLHRIGLTERAGLLLLLAMLFGSLIELHVAPGLSINLGAGLVPLLFVLWVLVSRKVSWEPLFGLAGGFVGALAALLLSRWVPTHQPTELNLFYLDAQYFYALVAGCIGYLFGQGLRPALVGAVLAVLGGDLAHYLMYVSSGEMADLMIRMGGGGFHGTAVVAAMLALALTEWLAPVAVEKGEAGVDHLPQS